MGNTGGTTGGNTGGQGGTGGPGNAGNSAGRTDWTIDAEGAARAANAREATGHGLTPGGPQAQPETAAGTTPGTDQGEGASSGLDEVRGNAMPPLAPGTEQTVDRTIDQN
jgi:hypothetical protein